MDKDRELSKLKNSILKFNKNFPGKNLVFSDGNKDANVTGMINRININ